MPSLWKFGGLTPLQLIRLVVRKFSEDEILTRSASLSYYFVLSLFPMLLFLVSLLGVLAGTRGELREAVISMIGRLAPGSATGLIREVLQQTVQSSGGLKLAAGILGALWAGSGGMSAVLTSLNVINEVEETRSWLKKQAVVLGLTLGLAVLILLSVALIVYGGKIGELIASHLSLGSTFKIAWTILAWIISLASMFLSFSLIYYFAPNLDERHWFWVTPGAATGVFLWLLSSLGLRAYLHFFNSYSATYGFIGAVIILMLWLFITGFAVLIGAEVNFAIESTDRHQAEFSKKKRALQQQNAA